MTEFLHTTSRKFTLKYWAVTMVILGLIAAALLPPLPAGGGSREKARRAVCMSNLKQLGLAIAMYADSDPQHRCPTDGEPSMLIGSMQLLSNIISTARILSCPSDSRARPEIDLSKLTARNISYSYVPNLIWNPDHADSIVALDRIYTTEKGGKWPFSGNHKDTGGNVLFGDGHARWVNSLPSALKDKDGKLVVLSP